MEYFFTAESLIEMAPGFVGIAVNKLFTGKAESERIEKYILRYFLYTIVSWLISNFVCYVFNITNTVTKIALLTIIAGSLGAMWHLILKELVLALANNINRLCGKNVVFDEKTVFERVFNDGKDHFIVVHKGDKIISFGFLEHLDYRNESFSLIPPMKGEHVINKGFKRSIIYTKGDLYLEEMDVCSETDVE